MKRLNNASISILTGILIALFIYLLRSSFIGFSSYVNADEAELLANGRLASKSLVPYDNFSTPTFGPMWPMFLGSLRNIGMPMTLPAAHLLSAIIWMIIFGTFWAASKSNQNLFFKFSIFLLLALSVGRASVPFTNSDIAVLHTESLSLLFLTFSYLAIVRSEFKDFYIYLAGIFFTLAILSKYQTLGMTPIFICVIYLTYKQNRKRFRVNSIKFVATISASLLSFYGICLLFETQSDFNRSIRFVIDYGNGTLTKELAPTFEDRIWNGFYLLFLSWPVLISVLIMLMITTMFLKKWELVSVITIFGIGFLTMAYPGNPFPHYSSYMIWSTLVVATFISAQSLIVPHGLTNLIMVIFVALFWISYIDPNYKFSSNVKNLSTFSESEQINQVTIDEKHLISNTCPPGSTVLIWGWASDYFSYFNWEPYTKIVNDSVGILNNHNNSEYITSKFTKAIESGGVNCFISVVGPNFFPSYEYPKFEVHSVSKEIGDTLDAYFKKVVTTKSGLELYVRK
jgi:hypothetical protein